MDTKDLALSIERAKKIKLVILDVHGVLTAQEILFDTKGNHYRPFAHDDEFGCNALMDCKIEVAIITRGDFEMTEARMTKIGVHRLYQTKEKIKKYEELLTELNLTEAEACFVGDEVIDIGVMRRVGLAVAPADAKPIAKEVAHYITRTAGGKGVIRELAEFILRAQGKWDVFVEKVINKGW